MERPEPVLSEADAIARATRRLENERKRLAKWLRQRDRRRGEEENPRQWAEGEGPRPPRGAEGA